MLDAALLLLRDVSGGLLAGHGAQKAFGSFEGPGPEGTRGFMQVLGFRPPHIWGRVAGLSELVGGSLTALGALSPIGPIVAIAPMVMATTTAHWGKPIWATQGGAELPVVNIAAFTTLAVTGPGALSVDRALGIRVPRWMVGLTVAGVAAGTAYALATRQTSPAPPQALDDEREREAVAAAAAASQEREVELHAARDEAARRRPAVEGR
ncbi:MAG TPA: DoxX family protein [Candidatus Angelobacter sp.]|jgi:putative oxidoreductase|nr:DoxX family protein [Candidatus Angelobacter sp.]